MIPGGSNLSNRCCRSLRRMQPTRHGSLLQERNPESSQKILSSDMLQKYDCELEQMAAGFQRVAYKVRDGYGWIMVQFSLKNLYCMCALKFMLLLTHGQHRGKGRDLDEKLDSAFKRPDWDKMKNARDKPARYGCYIDYDSAVMTCVYDKMLVPSAYQSIVPTMMVEILQDLKLGEPGQLLELNENGASALTINHS
ncbi:hypothetical protein ANCCAN_18799 [Ancylostoma caninum]|uniref:Uncharacterized protein n=1 Tax=Ancylostoma caninum TaxID=29170 RepID=A0A368FTB9_ANCCA|nr:hypothetical protein ANCCAN_18799 [Ancylostoma caninum]